MELYILRHGIAVSHGTPGFPNDDRPLTEEGREKMTRAARGIENLDPMPEVILTSPLKRAHETAVITAKAFGIEKNLKICTELSPGTSIDVLCTALQPYQKRKSVMLVGHEPLLSAFATHLLGMVKSHVELKKGSLCRIDVEKLRPSPVATLVWLLTPKQLRLIAETKDNDKKPALKKSPVSRKTHRRRGD